MNYRVNEKGYYGPYGGAYVSAPLQQKLDELTAAFHQITSTATFKEELHHLLTTYVGRPTPLYHASRLSAKYHARIFLKREDLCHTGAHKINNALGQILLARQMGKQEIIAETGAGQHGVATATAAALLGMKCKIFMGAHDMKRQKINVQKMEMLGAEIIPVLHGGAILSDAVDAALDYWVDNLDSFYLLGSAVGPHPYPMMVEYFQSVISNEIRTQLPAYDTKEAPDYVIAPIGGGSNAAGAFYHFIDDEKVKLIGVEAAGIGVYSGSTAATLTIGTDTIYHGSRSVAICDEKGAVIEPYSISAGLDYPGVGPLHAAMVRGGRATILAATDNDAIAAAFELTRLEGIIPALESAHALAALSMLSLKPDDIVVVNLSGRGDKDLETYLKFVEAR